MPSHALPVVFQPNIALAPILPADAGVEPDHARRELESHDPHHDVRQGSVGRGEPGSGGGVRRREAGDGRDVREQRVLEDERHARDEQAEQAAAHGQGVRLRPGSAEDGLMRRHAEQAQHRGDGVQHGRASRQDEGYGGCRLFGGRPIWRQDRLYVISEDCARALDVRVAIASVTS